MALPLRIGFNGRTFTEERIRGFTRHTLALIKELQALKTPPEIHLFTDHKIHPVHQSVLEGCKIHHLPIRPNLVWEQVALPVEIALNRLDVFHSTLNVGIPAIRIPNVRRIVTVHDLITVDGFAPDRVKTFQDRKAKLRFELSWKAALTADAVITVSHYSAERILERYPFLQGRLHVIPNGVEQKFSPGASDPKVLARHALSGPFFLYVGGFDRRKNVEMLLQSFQLFCEQHPSDAQLAIVGSRDNLPPQFQELAKDTQRIRWLDYIADRELINLYRAAKAVILPSKEEGFGFQLVEAMACGAPVFSSHATSLPEVGGNAADYFNPDEPHELIALLARALRDPAWLLGLQTLGSARAQDFTWEKAAQATLNIY